MFDTADAYSRGASERILGKAVRSRRDRVIISTKTGLPTSESPGDWGVSRHRLVECVEGSLRRLQTEYVDLLLLHALGAATPADEVLETLETLMTSGEVRQIGVSNYPGWQLMNALAAADYGNLPRFATHQIYYSLIDTAYEAELMPLAAEQGVGALIWSALGWGRLTGKVRRGSPPPRTVRLHGTAAFAPAVEEEHLYRVVEALEVIAEETGKIGAPDRGQLAPPETDRGLGHHRRTQ